MRSPGTTRHSDADIEPSRRENCDGQVDRLPATTPRAYTYDAATLKKKWARLHAGDAEPLPKDDKVLAAWALFHAGEFQKATEAGLKARRAPAHDRRQQGAGDLRQLPREEREDQAGALPRGRRARREAQPATTRRNANALVLHGLRARPLQPGHQRRQGAGAGARRARSRTRSRRRSSSRPSTPTRTSRSAPSTPR